MLFHKNHPFNEIKPSIPLGDFTVIGAFAFYGATRVLVRDSQGVERVFLLGSLAGATSKEWKAIEAAGLKEPRRMGGGHLRKGRYSAKANKPNGGQTL